MENTKPMTIGQNLRRIRKELGLRQQDIVGEEITRNLISMIENDKAPMSYSIAQVASENINKISKTRDVEVHIAPEDIMNPKRIEAKKGADKYIRELRRQIENKDYDIDREYISKIVDFLNQWKVPEKKVVIYDLLGEISYLKRDYKWEYIYLNKALENYYIAPVKKDIYVIGINLMVNCISNGRYDEAITLSELDFMNSDDIPKEQRAIIYYNKALAYKRLKEYDKALEMLNEYEDFFKENNVDILRMSLVVKGICYSNKNEKDEAIIVYKKIIDSFEKEHEEVGLAYSNIVSILKELDLKEEAIEYKVKLMDIIPYLEKKNNRYLVKIYCTLAEINEYIDNNEMAEYFYISAINKSVDIKDNDRCADVLFKLLNLYNETNQPDKILLSNNIFKRGFDNSQVSNEIKLAFSLVLTNMKLGKEEMATDIISNILKKEGKDEAED